MIIPGNHVPLPVQPTTNLHHHRRGFWLPDELIFASPLHSHGSTHSLGQDDSVCGRIVRAILPVGPRPFHMDHMHMFNWHVEQLCQSTAQRVGSRCARPDYDLMIAYFRYGAGRPNGRMSVIWMGIGCMHLLCRTGKGVLEITPFNYDVVLGWLAAQC